MAEVEAVFQRQHERDRQEHLRFGLIAATLVNVHRRKGARIVKPSDFLEAPKQHLSPKDSVSFLDAIASHHVKAPPKAPRNRKRPT